MDSSGKIFLNDLIARAEVLLAAMSAELNKSNLPLPVIVRMINSVHQIVATWEAILADIRPTAGCNAERRNGADGEEEEEEDRNPLLDATLPAASEMEPQQNRGSRQEGVGEMERSPPVFDAPDVPLERYDLGQTGTGHITCVCSSTSDDEFYMIDQTAKGLQLAEVLKTLQNLDERLDVVPESATAVFGVRFEGTIMRAVRNKVHGEGEPCFIQLLDTGEIVPLDTSMELYEVPPFYARLAPFAVPCRLEGFEDNAFKAGDKRAFLGASLYETKWFQVVQVGRSRLVVRLGPPGETKQVVQKEAAVPEPSYKISMDTLSPDQVEELNEEPLNTTNVMKAVLGYVPQDDRRICPFYDPTIEGCFKGSGCRLEHVAKLEDGWTRDKVPHKIKIRAEMEQPRVGSEMVLIPTFVANVNEFYAHICLPKLSEALIDMQSKLNDPEYTRDFKLLNHEPHFCELVFAKYAVDGRWYRAEVVEFFSLDRISVFYVDYGNRDTLKIDQLRYWDDRFDYLPFQAVHCRVANIKPLKQNHPEATDQFRRAVLDHGVKIHVLDNQTPWEVLIYDEDGEDIGEILVMTKLAARRQPLVMDHAGAIPA
ncbi:conserved hypothetical protein [Culex quinquefasciatus]|uniref:Tudor domain-containing protein n=1 Tax=Culex quinquefasciatus TaxID=7176 RepID=B0W3H6_CULQU|nr:conserved hypothetical protein [Culex quinquefasciatus]|eukprot:XP_001843260.1 conserved hypothetical protein [Culex quinquefasciatus]